jgi:hypothetical protein
MNRTILTSTICALILVISPLQSQAAAPAAGHQGQVMHYRQLREQVSWQGYRDPCCRVRLTAITDAEVNKWPGGGKASRIQENYIRDRISGPGNELKAGTACKCNFLAGIRLVCCIPLVLADRPVPAHDYRVETEDGRYVFVMLAPRDRPARCDPQLRKRHRQAGMHRNDVSSAPLRAAGWYQRRVCNNRHHPHWC